MNSNYTSICFYCGEIFKSNRSTGRYCNKQHNSMYNTYGARINNSILKSKGIYVDYCPFFRRIFNESFKHSLGWRGGYRHELLRHIYDGPLPLGDELLLVSSFLIMGRSKVDRSDKFYFIKPFELLTMYERATRRIIKGQFESESCR
jgi:uncharacterized C2H2 Zn-finger protein